MTPFPRLAALAFLLSGCLTMDGADLVIKAERSVVRTWMSSGDPVPTPAAPPAIPTSPCPRHCVYTFVSNGGHACCTYCARSCTGCWTKADGTQACAN